MADRVCAKFVSKKIRKVRWQPPVTFGRHNPECFVTGSWDDEVSHINYSIIYYTVHIFVFFLVYFFKYLLHSKMRYRFGIPFNQMSRILILSWCLLFLFLGM